MQDGFVFATVIRVYGEGLGKLESNNLDAKYVIWQVKIWDVFAKIMPAATIISLGVFYLLGYRDWNLIYSIGEVFFVTVAITWWFWVIYTIATIAVVISNSGKSIKEIIKEVKEIRKIIQDENINNHR